MTKTPKVEVPQKSRMATGFALALMGKSAPHDEAAAEMFKGNIRAQDVAQAAAWFVAVALKMKAIEEAGTAA